MLERSHEEQEQLIASLESIVECYKMEMALNRFATRRVGQIGQ